MLFEFIYIYLPGMATVLVSLIEMLWSLVEFAFPSLEEPLNVFYETFMLF